jgi:group I intron endonuclease
MWTCLKSGRSYVGSALNLSRRLTNYYSNTYLLKTNRGKSIIYNALLKYEHSGFKLDILEYCAPNDIIEREQYFISLLKPEYNILAVARSSFSRSNSRIFYFVM